MANPVFSTRLFARVSTATTSEDSNPVPAGFVWVVRSVSVQSPGAAYSVEHGWALSINGVGVICGVGTGFGSGGSYYLFDTHQVVNTSQVLHFGSSVPAYDFVVSGYQLTLP